MSGLRHSQFGQTKKRRENNMFHCNNITLEISSHYLMKTTRLLCEYWLEQRININIHVQYSDIMKLIVHHNYRHHKVSRSSCPRIVTILFRIKVRGTPRDAYTVCQVSHYSGVLDNPQHYCKFDMIHELTTCANLQAWAFIFSKVNK